MSEEYQCKWQHKTDEEDKVRCEFYANSTIYEIDSTASMPIDACRYCLENNADLINEKDKLPIDEIQKTLPFQSFHVMTIELKKKEVNCIHNRSVLGKRYYAQSKESLDVINCDHPNHHEPTFKECMQCKDRKRKPLGQKTSNLVVKSIELTDRRPPFIQNRKAWAVGVTTAFREESTINQTIDDIKANDWNPIVFSQANGVDAIDSRHSDCELVSWPKSRKLEYLAEDNSIIKTVEGTIGAFSNWLCAMQYLIQCEPTAEAYVLFQDDMQIFHGTREYLNDNLWPDNQDRFGFLSLYTSAKYDQKQYGWYNFNTALKTKKTDRWTWGACAIVFSPFSIRKFVASQVAMWHRAKRFMEKPRRGTNKLDVCLGCWARDTNHSVWFLQPSFTQHIGMKSAIWERSDATGKRRARTWVGEI